MRYIQASDNPFRRSQCLEDWLEIYEIYRDGTEEFVGRYCDKSTPGPVVSKRGKVVGLKVTLRTNDEDVYSGIFGRYMFFKEKSIFGDSEWFRSVSDFQRSSIDPIFAIQILIRP